MIRWFTICVLLASRLPAVAQDELVTPQQVAAMRKAYYALREENRRLKGEMAGFRERTSAAQREHYNVLTSHTQALLESSDPKLQRSGLRLMLLPAMTADGKRQVRPYSTSIEKIVIDMVESKDPQIARMAVELLPRYSRSAADRLGLQPGDEPWRPLDTDTISQFRLRPAFYQRGVDLSGRWTLNELAQHLSDLLDLEVQLSPDVEANDSIQFNKRSRSLLDYAELALEPRGLTVLMTRDGLEILRTADRRSRATRTYQVRGILNARRTLPQVVKHLQAALDEHTEVTSIAPHLVIVLARETQQRQAGIALRKFAAQPQ